MGYTNDEIADYDDASMLHRLADVGGNVQGQMENGEIISAYATGVSGLITAPIAATKGKIGDAFNNITAGKSWHNMIGGAGGSLLGIFVGKAAGSILSKVPIIGGLLSNISVLAGALICAKIGWDSGDNIAESFGISLEPPSYSENNAKVAAVTTAAYLPNDIALSPVAETQDTDLYLAPEHEPV